MAHNHTAAVVQAAAHASLHFTRHARNAITDGQTGTQERNTFSPPFQNDSRHVETPALQVKKKTIKGHKTTWRAQQRLQAFTLVKRQELVVHAFPSSFDIPRSILQSVPSVLQHRFDNFIFPVVVSFRFSSPSTFFLWVCPSACIYYTPFFR